MELWLSLEQCRDSLYVVLTALFLSGTLHRLTMIYTYSIAYKFPSLTGRNRTRIARIKRISADFLPYWDYPR
jgi:hypothetical protein